MWDVGRLAKRLKEIFDEYGYDLTDKEYRTLNIADRPDINMIYNKLGGWTKAKFLANRSIYDIEVITENVRLAKQRQKFMDSNRIERRSFRNFARIDNALEEYSKELIKLLKENNLSRYTKSHKSNGGAVGCVQLSDLHMNEKIDLEFNQYNFKIASARLKYFANRTIDYFKNINITNVLVAMTSDLLNSDRRIDELLTNATNRSRATFLAVDILQQFLLHLNEHFSVSVIGVSGNESRVREESGRSDIVATENYDWVIFEFLRYLFEGSDISFITFNDFTEAIVNVAGQNLLVTHGADGISHSHIEKSITQTIGRYSLEGTNIDYIILGHNHSARIGDNYSRSSSLAGANDYSAKSLNLAGRASQNIYVFYENGNRDGIKIDLQNYNKDDMYPIDEKLEEYCVKSASKIRKQETIVRIVV